MKFYTYLHYKTHIIDDISCVYIVFENDVLLANRLIVNKVLCDDESFETSLTYSILSARTRLDKRRNATARSSVCLLND